MNIAGIENDGEVPSKDAHEQRSSPIALAQALHAVDRAAVEVESLRQRDNVRPPHDDALGEGRESDVGEEHQAIEKTRLRDEV